MFPCTGPRFPADRLPVALVFPLGCVATIAVAFDSVAAGATTRPVWSLIALAGTTGSLACVSTLGAAVATAAFAWAVHAGFVLGRHGDLALTPAATRDAIALLAAALVAFTIATAIRAVGDRVAQRSAPCRSSAPRPRQPAFGPPGPPVERERDGVSSVLARCRTALVTGLSLDYAELVLRALMNVIEDGRRDAPTDGTPWTVLEGLAAIVIAEKRTSLVSP